MLRTGVLVKKTHGGFSSPKKGSQMRALFIFFYRKEVIVEGFKTLLFFLVFMIWMGIGFFRE